MEPCGQYVLSKTTSAKHKMLNGAQKYEYYFKKTLEINDKG